MKMNENGKRNQRICRAAAVFTFIIFICSVILPAVTATEMIPVPPNEFYGKVLLNGANAPVGTEIKAYIDGELRGSFIVKAPGEYGNLAVKGSPSDSGKTITFTVGGIPADQTATWQEMNPPRRLNLSAEGEPVEATPTPAVTRTPTPTPVSVNGESEGGKTSSLLSPRGIVGSVADLLYGNNDKSEGDKEESSNWIYEIIIILLTAALIVMTLLYFTKRKQGGMD